MVDKLTERPVQRGEVGGRIVIVSRVGEGQDGDVRPQNGVQRPTWGAYMEDGDIFGGGRKTREGFTSMENAIANQFERETGISIDSVESVLNGLANGDYNSANWVARIARRWWWWPTS